MKPLFRNFKIKLTLILAGCFIGLFFMNNAAGPAAAGHGGRTGASFDSGSCSGCHTSASPATVTVKLMSGSTVVTSYSPGGSYTLKVSIAATIISSTNRYGLQAVCVQSGTNNDVAGWGSIGTLHTDVWNSRTYIEQSASLLTASTSIPWTAPAAGTGSVVFYVGGVSVNNDMTDLNDHPGTGTLTVTEGVACVPPALSTTVTNVLCFGDFTGAVNLTTSGGSAVTGYSWTGPGGFTSTASSISGLAAGTYTVVVTASGGCQDTTTATVTQPASALSLSLTSNSPICVGSTLSLSSTASGGTGAIHYLWSGPGGFSSTAANPFIAGADTTASGTYSLTITDANGCTHYDTTVVAVGATFSFSLGNDTTLCPGHTLTLGSASISGDTYLWSTAATTSTITISDTGTYWLTITNSAGCVGHDTIHVHRCVTAVTDPSYSGNEEAVAMYPNPVTGTIVTFKGNGATTLNHICVYDIRGMKVYDQPVAAKKEQTADLAGAPAGVYLVIVNTSAGTVSKRLTIGR